MRHYEVVFLIHPNKENQIEGLIEKYRSVVTEDEGQVHRLENWGRRELAYPIKKNHHAYYILMNIECNLQALRSLKNLVEFNENILRSQVLKMDKAITNNSFIVQADLLEKEKLQQELLNQQAEMEANQAREAQVEPSNQEQDKE